MGTHTRYTDSGSKVQTIHITNTPRKCAMLGRGTPAPTSTATAPEPAFAATGPIAREPVTWASSGSEERIEGLRADVVDPYSSRDRLTVDAMVHGRQM